MILVYTVFPNNAEAKRVAQKIVSEKLAACANILPACSSFFNFGARIKPNRRGKASWREENPVFFKTTAGKRRLVERRIMQLHSYKTPLVASWRASGNASFEKWLGKTLG